MKTYSFDRHKNFKNISFILMLTFLCGLAGCNYENNDISKNFKERQKKLLYDTNCKPIYESCQNLMRNFREGTLSENLFFLDAPKQKLKMLPESILYLNPLYVHVTDLKTDIVFYDEGRTQILSCDSNEFGNIKPKYGKAKGEGYINNPVKYERLNGKESLDYLNNRYEHFYIELIPGMEYQKIKHPGFKSDTFKNLTEVKEKIKSDDLMAAFLSKDLNDSAVKKQQLLYKTDHNEFLKACREILLKYKKGEIAKNQIDINDEYFVKELIVIPEIIKNLKEGLIHFDKDFVKIIFAGGFNRFGIIAYEDNKIDADENEMKIINGLFYFDEGLKKVGEDYKKYLIGIEKDSLSYNNWKRKQMNLPMPDYDRWIKRAENRFNSND